MLCSCSHILPHSARALAHARPTMLRIPLVALCTCRVGWTYYSSTILVQRLSAHCHLQVCWLWDKCDHRTCTGYVSYTVAGITAVHTYLLLYFFILVNSDPIQQLYQKNGGILLDNHMVTDIIPGHVITVVTTRATSLTKKLGSYHSK